MAEQLDAGRQLAEERAAEAEKRAEAYAAQGASLQSDASNLSRKLREAEHAVSRTRQEAAAEKERLERKINDQKEVDTLVDLFVGAAGLVEISQRNCVGRYKIACCCRRVWGSRRD